MSGSDSIKEANNIIDYLDHLKDEIREELDDHLESINENTEEIAIQNSAVCEIDNRLNKLEEKMDRIHFMFKQLIAKSLISVELSKKEQQVFLILYTHDGFLGMEGLSPKANLSRSAVEDALVSLMDKGIPIEREIIDKDVYFRLNQDFRLRQAKDSIVRIDPDVKRQFQNTLLRKFFQSET